MKKSVDDLNWNNKMNIETDKSPKDGNAEESNKQRNPRMIFIAAQEKKTVFRRECFLAKQVYTISFSYEQYSHLLCVKTK